MSTTMRTLPPKGRVCRLTGRTPMTLRQAVRAATWFRRAGFGRMTQYRCGSCRSWHLGISRRGQGR